MDNKSVRSDHDKSVTELRPHPQQDLSLLAGRRARGRQRPRDTEGSCPVNCVRGVLGSCCGSEKEARGKIELQEP